MNTIETLVNDFLSQRTIAVVGVSSKPQSLGNAVYQKLKTPHRTIVAVHPHLTTFEGDTCYPDLRSVPRQIDGVFIATKAENTERVVDDCIALNIPRVWMHHSFGLQHSHHTSKISSVSANAVQKCREHNITVIPGACPMMFVEPRDGFHSCLRWFLSVTGKLRTP